MDIKSLDLQKMAGRLKCDLDSLLRVISDAPRCLCNHNDTSECRQQPCTWKASCHVNISQSLHHLRYATFASFKHELEVLNVFQSPRACDRHKEKQAQLSSAINGVIGRYNDSGNCLETLAGMSRVAGPITDYASSIDVTMKQCLSHSQLMAAA